MSRHHLHSPSRALRTRLAKAGFCISGLPLGGSLARGSHERRQTLRLDGWGGILPREARIAGAGAPAANRTFGDSAKLPSARRGAGRSVELGLTRIPTRSGRAAPEDSVSGIHDHSLWLGAMRWPGFRRQAGLVRKNGVFPLTTDATVGKVRVEQSERPTEVFRKPGPREAGFFISGGQLDWPIRSSGAVRLCLNGFRTHTDGGMARVIAARLGRRRGQADRIRGVREPSPTQHNRTLRLLGTPDAVNSGLSGMYPEALLLGAAVIINAAACFCSGGR